MEEQQIQIRADDNIIKGVYANVMAVNHTKEEFVLEFLNIFPPQGSLVSRVFTSPGHMKRIQKALEENIKNYEKQFGKIEEAEAPDSRIGFKTGE